MFIHDHLSRMTTSQGFPPHKDDHLSGMTTNQGFPPHKDSHLTRIPTSLGWPPHKDDHLSGMITNQGFPPHKDSHLTRIPTSLGQRPLKDDHQSRMTTKQEWPLTLSQVQTWVLYHVTYNLFMKPSSLSKHWCCVSITIGAICCMDQSAAWLNLPCGDKYSVESKLLHSDHFAFNHWCWVPTIIGPIY